MTMLFSFAFDLFIVYVVYVSGSDFDCEFHDSYPRQYVAHKIPSNTLTIDGILNEDAWQMTPFTADFVDISTAIVPKFQTKVKILWSDEFLYVAAILQETDVWANITETCHCNTSSNDQVIYHDNDFEVFIDTDGDTHFYKEFEMNSLNATWDLILTKSYSDGGYENSSRVYGKRGFDMQPPLLCGTSVDGSVNDPTSEDSSWTVEIAIPYSKLKVNESGTFPPKNGTFWRINFSRVEWGVEVVEGPTGTVYWKLANCQSCASPGAPVEDNWVWSPQGAVNMHLPEKWGMLQFTEKPPGEDEAVAWNDEWPLRNLAMILYYAEHAYAADHNGIYTDDLTLLNKYANPPILDKGICSELPRIDITNDEATFVADITDKEGKYTVVIRDDRLLKINAHL